jgi:hypothetical protein
MNLNLRLRLLKLLLNVPVRLLNRVLPERKATFPQTQILEKMYTRMFQAYRLERSQGVFSEADGRVEDGNFLRLLQISRKLLVGISEDDRYYREWLGLLVVLASEEYQRWLSSVTPQEIKHWCASQWYVSPTCLSDQGLNEVKAEIAPDALCYYLHILAGKTIGHSNLKVT